MTANRYASIIICLLVSAGLFSCQSNEQKKVLVFSTPAGNETTQTAHVELLRKISGDKKISVDTTSVLAYFAEDSLEI